MLMTIVSAAHKHWRQQRIRAVAGYSAAWVYMKLKFVPLVLAAAAALLLWAQRPPAPTPQQQFSAVIDLTHPIGEQTSAYDLADKFEARVTASYDKQGYFMRSISLPEHFGTHLDA